MKRVLMLITICWMIGGITPIANAQEPLFNGTSSAGILDQPVWFNCDYADTTGIPGVEVKLHYMGQSNSDFIDVTMSEVNEPPYYEFTYDTDVTFSENPDVLEYYFSAGADSYLATQSPKNTSNQFPPVSYKYAPFVSDPQGDTVDGSAGGWLDLTGSGMTYSDTRVYGYLENATGSWPLSQGLDYFIYGLGFLTTDGSDSAFYALIYANIPFVLNSGLFKLNLTDSSYTRIGNINYSVSGSKLHMACYFTEFESDPDWPGWPPPEDIIVSSGVTITVGLSGQALNDFTYGTYYEPATQYLDFNSNTTPVLASYQLELEPDISLIPKVNYQDQDNNLPVRRWFFFGFGVYDMGSYDHIYNDTSEFEKVLAWPIEGWHYFHFEFSDGAETITTPNDSIYIAPAGYQYLPGDANMYNGIWPPECIGSDVTYLVSHFRGLPNEPCLLLGDLWASADANGDCNIIGSDVTRLVNYFRGNTTLLFCVDYEPAWLTPDDLPLEAPSGWPNCENPAVVSDIQVLPAEQR